MRSKVPVLLSVFGLLVTLPTIASAMAANVAVWLTGNRLMAATPWSRESTRLGITRSS